MALERLSFPVPVEPWLWPALQCCPQGVDVGGEVVFRAALAGRCELHPAAQIKGTSAGHIHRKAFNAQPWSREIYSRDSFPCLNVKKLCQLDIQETLLNTFLFV